MVVGICHFRTRVQPLRRAMPAAELQALARPAANLGLHDDDA